jgi:hypothetical protein
MGNSESLAAYVSAADRLEEQAQLERMKALREICTTDCNISALLEDFWDDPTDRVAWLFSRRAQRYERPVDLIVQGRCAEVETRIRMALYGLCI